MRKTARCNEFAFAPFTAARARGIVAGRGNGMLHWVRLESLRNVIEFLQLPDEGHRQRRQNQLLDYVKQLGASYLPPADWQMPKRERFALSA